MVSISVANLDGDGGQSALPEGIKPIEYSGQQHIRHPDPVPEAENMFYGISVSFET
jgi:hypothetical protein